MKHNDSLHVYLDDFLKFQGAAGYSASSYRKNLKPFFDFCCDNYPNQPLISQKMVDTWLRHNKYTANSQASFISRLRQCCRYLNFRGIEAYIPDEDYTVKRTVYEPYMFTDEELSSFFDAVDRYAPSKNNRKHRPEIIVSPLFRMMYCCGMRPGEPLALKCDEVHLKTGDIYINKTKTHKSRHITMSRDLANLCREYDVLAGKRTWFFEYYGNPYTSQWATAQFGHCWSRCGMSPHGNPRPYYLRHAFATRNLAKWIDDGLDVNALLPYLSTYMGHSKISSTLYYVHLLPEKLRRSPGIDWERLSAIYEKADRGDGIED